jgi:hypothetical protein
MRNHQRGEIITILTIGTFLVLGISTLIGSTFLNKNKSQTTQTKAASSCNAGVYDVNLDINSKICTVTASDSDQIGCYIRNSSTDIPVGCEYEDVPGAIRVERGTTYIRFNCTEALKHKSGQIGALRWGACRIGNTNTFRWDQGVWKNLSNNPPSEGEVCPAENLNKSCNEQYYEGKGADRKLCHKQGVCNGVGDGTKCSWGAGSYCEPAPEVSPSTLKSLEENKTCQLSNDLCDPSKGLTCTFTSGMPAGYGLCKKSSVTQNTPTPTPTAIPIPTAKPIETNTPTPTIVADTRPICEKDEPCPNGWYCNGSVISTQFRARYCTQNKPQTSRPQPTPTPIFFVCNGLDEECQQQSKTLKYCTGYVRGATPDRSFAYCTNIAPTPKPVYVGEGEGCNFSTVLCAQNSGLTCSRDYSVPYPVFTCTKAPSTTLTKAPPASSLTHYREECTVGTYSGVRFVEKQCTGSSCKFACKNNTNLYISRDNQYSGDCTNGHSTCFGQTDLSSNSKPNNNILIQVVVSGHLPPEMKETANIDKVGVIVQDGKSQREMIVNYNGDAEILPLKFVGTTKREISFTPYISAKCTSSSQSVSNKVSTDTKKMYTLPSQGQTPLQDINFDLTVDNLQCP